MGWSVERVRTVLARLIAEGRAESLEVWRGGIDNRLHRVPAYRLRRRDGGE
jgi:Leu/Phe-tRNA-protein transferase